MDPHFFGQGSSIGQSKKLLGSLSLAMRAKQGVGEGKREGKGETGKGEGDSGGRDKGRKREGKGKQRVGEEKGKAVTWSPQLENCGCAPASICNFKKFPGGYTRTPLKRGGKGGKVEVEPHNIFPKSAPTLGGPVWWYGWYRTFHTDVKHVQPMRLRARAAAFIRFITIIAKYDFGNRNSKAKGTIILQQC
jgi:hypothetical protein